MADKSVTPEGPSEDAETPVAPPVVAPPPKRSPGHRGADVKDTVAEMTAKAHEISLEAGSKMAAAMKDVINAAAGLTGFVVESARDLVQYMVRRGQMTQEEADKLIRQAEDAQVGRPVPPTRPAEPENVVKPAAPKATPAVVPPAAPKPASTPSASSPPASSPPASAPAVALDSDAPDAASAKPVPTEKPAAATIPPKPKAAAPKPATSKPAAPKTVTKPAPKKPAALTAHTGDHSVTKKPAAKPAAKKVTAKRK